MDPNVSGGNGVTNGVGADGAPRALSLSGGRTVLVLGTGGQEEIQVRSPQGEMEVQIVLTEAGPVVRLRAARLELESVEDMNLACRRFALHTQEETKLTSAGQLRLHADQQILMRSKEEMDLKGRPFRVNLFDGMFDNDYFYPLDNGPTWGTAFQGMEVTIDPRYEALLNGGVEDVWLQEMASILLEIDERKRALESHLQATLYQGAV